MKAYLINLDRSPERLAESDKVLAAAGIAYERIRAVDGKELTADEVRLQCSRIGFLLANGRRVKLNELGCALSHQKAWRELLASDAPRAAVFEDDVAIDPAAYAAAERLIASEDDPARPIIWLLNHRNLVPDPGRSAAVRLLDTKDDVMHTWGTEGYVLNRAAAEALLSFTVPVRYVADAWPTYARHGVDVRVVFPTPCTLRETPSVIARSCTGRDAWAWYRKFGWFKYRVCFRIDILLWRLRHPKGRS